MAWVNKHSALDINVASFLLNLQKQQSNERHLSSNYFPISAFYFSGENRKLEVDQIDVLTMTENCHQFFQRVHFGDGLSERLVGQ